MIETWDQLREEFLLLKLPKDLHPLCYQAWEDALNFPCPQLIWKFYQLGGADRHFRELQVNWLVVQKDYLHLSGPV